MVTQSDHDLDLYCNLKSYGALWPNESCIIASYLLTYLPLSTFIKIIQKLQKQFENTEQKSYVGG